MLLLELLAFCSMQLRLGSVQQPAMPHNKNGWPSLISTDAIYCYGCCLRYCAVLCCTAL